MARVALIGLGHWGKNLLRNLADLDALVGVCDQDEQLLAERIEDHSEIVATTRYEELLGDSKVQGVVIATPAASHYEHARLALLCGKDVFVEKPLSLTYREGAELVRLAEERERILMVGHVLEYHPAVTRLFELISGGELGEVRYLYSHRLSLGKVRTEENILWSFAPHDIAIILRMMDGLPLEVVACGGSYIQPNIPDVTVTHLLFDNGVRAHIHVSWLHPFKEQRLVVIGSHKMASFNDVTKSLVVYDQRVEIDSEGPVPMRGKRKEVAFPVEEPLRVECQAFLEAIRTRKPPLTDGASGLRVLRVLQAGQRSLVTNGQPVALLPLSLEG